VKKKFWRCHVCNDLHWGLTPPEICPTCGVKNAYVEIAAGEARTILGLSMFKGDPSISPAEFRAAIEAFAAANEFSVNPDAARVALLFEGLFENEKNHGLKFCPCRLISKDPVEDVKLICPCNFPSHETYRGRERGECWCGLFIRR
jgi:ferredoxin-thioredoxin reductase catalytic chain